MRLPLALIICMLPASAFAADAKPAVDLIATFITGASDGGIIAFAGGQYSGTMKQTGPGTYETATGNNGPVVDFAITEKSDCVFDVVFSAAQQSQGGIEIDAHKLKSVTYTLQGAKDTYSDWSITLDGSDPSVVQSLAPDGTLAATTNSSVISTSLKDTDMQAAVSAFQSTYCPAAS